MVPLVVKTHTCTLNRASGETNFFFVGFAVKNCSRYSRFAALLNNGTMRKMRDVVIPYDFEVSRSLVAVAIII
jgi:hypothetical protein